MLTSTKNPLVKQIKKLQQVKGRKKQNLFLLEGNHLITAACEYLYPLEVVCFTPQWQEKNSELAARIKALAKRVEIVSLEVLKAMATTLNPEGVIATAKILISDDLAEKKANLGLILERIQDPGNLGTIIRTAVATGVDNLSLSQDSVDIYNPKVLRASVGEWFKLPLQVRENLVKTVQIYQQQGMQVVATVPTAKKSYWEIDFNLPTLILLGNEAAGLSSELISLADELVTIPLAGGVESLNVGIATAVILYEVRRQRALKLVA